MDAPERAPMKDFKAAVVEHQNGTDDVDAEVLEFSINGEKDRPYQAYVPTEDQIALFAAAFGDDAKEANVMSSTMDFLRNVLVKESYHEIRARIADRNDPVGIETMQQILEWIFEEFAGFPTQPSSGSTSSRRPGGEKLTDHLPPKAQTRSRSPRGASATSSTRGVSRE